MPEYEGAVIRPPSEADSLVLQYTIGCSHNQCTFCPAYKQKRFRIRSLVEMEQDVRGCLPACADTRRIFLADGDALAAPYPDLLALFPLLVPQALADRHVRQRKEHPGKVGRGTAAAPGSRARHSVSRHRERGR